MYETLAKFAQTWGTVYFVLIFLGVLIYAFWPANKKSFDEAARTVLNDEEPGDD